MHYTGLNVNGTHIGEFEGKVIATEFELKTKVEPIDELANDANGTAIATAVNSIIAALIEAGILEEAVTIEE